MRSESTTDVTILLCTASFYLLEHALFDARQCFCDVASPVRSSTSPCIGFPEYCRVIVYLISMTQRASTFWVPLRARALCVPNLSMISSPFTHPGNRLLYGGYFLRVELTVLSRNRHCDLWPRGEINCVVQIPHNDREKLQNSTRVRIGPLQRATNEE